MSVMLRLSSLLRLGDEDVHSEWRVKRSGHAFATVHWIPEMETAVMMEYGVQLTACGRFRMNIKTPRGLIGNLGDAEREEMRICRACAAEWGVMRE